MQMKGENKKMALELAFSRKWGYFISNTRTILIGNLVADLSFDKTIFAKSPGYYAGSVTLDS